MQPVNKERAHTYIRGESPKQQQQKKKKTEMQKNAKKKVWATKIEIIIHGETGFDNNATSPGLL